MCAPVQNNNRTAMTAAETIAMNLSTESTTATDTACLSKQDVLVHNDAVVCPEKPQLKTGEEKALKVLFLSSDTGGGHRASAESLAAQFQILFPGSTYHLVDLATESYLPPYNHIVSYYKHLSAHPHHWKLLYGVTNSRLMERAVDTNIKVMTLMCERSIRKKIKSYEPDVVVSVHPLQTSVPILSCAKISHETGKHLPMFTVVTDLGSAHSTWFANGVERMFVGSTQIYDLAKERGQVPDEKLVLLGLPIRNDFAEESKKLGFRMGLEGGKYQKEVRERLGLPATDRKTLLVMGGGEGVGSLSSIVDAVYCELVKQDIDAVIMVVCGRNEKLKKSLEERDWQDVFQKRNTKKGRKKNRGLFPPIPMFSDLGGCGDSDISPVGCIQSGGFNSLRKILSSGSLMTSASPVFIPSPTKAITEEKKDESMPVESANGDAEKTNNHSDRKPLEFKSNSIGPIEIHESPVVFDKHAHAPVRELSKESPSDHTPDITTVGTTSIESPASNHGKVAVVGLGFVSNMAQYMVAADVLVSKAGPGTISEAAALSLPVMLTSFLPGQEEGNVDYVIEGKFGAYCHDSDPQAVAEELAVWLNDDEKMLQMSQNAKQKGAPYAARDIVQQIGDSTLKWREINEGAEQPQDATNTHVKSETI